MKRMIMQYKVHFHQSQNEHKKSDLLSSLDKIKVKLFDYKIPTALIIL